MALRLHRRTLLAAAGSVLARPAVAQPPRVLRFVPEGNLANPDPVWTTTTIARNHAYLIWDTLYGNNGKGVQSPQMAAGDEVSGDGLTWRITLRAGLTFHDGTPVLARDCVPSILRWGKRRGLGQKMLERLDNIRARDDRSIEIRLNKPFPLMRAALAEPFMMPERMALTDPFQQISEYVGSGPYRFLRDEWVAGARAVYARHENYQPRLEKPEFTAGGKVANFDRVEWVVMPDPGTAASALQQGEVDWWQNPLVDLLGTLREAPGVRVMQNDSIGAIAMLALNHTQPPFDNPDLRRALLPAIDQEEFMQAAWGSEPGLYRTGVGVFTPGMPMANDAGLAALTDPRDPERAQQMIADSGYGGEKIALLAPSDYPDLQALSQVANDLFQRVGLMVDYLSMDWGSLVQRRASHAAPDKGGWNAFCTTYEGLSVATPASHLPLRGNGDAGWFGWPTSPRMEALRDAWFDAPDLAAQQAICAQMQALAFEEVPFIPLGQRFSPTAMRTDIVDVVPAPFPIFWNVRRAH